MIIRVWCVVNIPNDMRIYNGFSSIEEAKKFVDILANEQLSSDKVISNVFGIDVLVDGEWEDYELYYDEEE
mgnify:CR=1 FL=1